MHKRFSQLAAFDDAGELIGEEKLYHDDQPAIAQYFRDLGDKTTVALEATRSWYWLYELLEAEGVTVKLVNPRRVRLIAESTVKTDKIDAQVLADLERIGYLPQAYIPPREVRDNRELLRYRMMLVHDRSRFKNAIHAMIDKLGITHHFSDLFSPAGRTFLAELELRPVYRKAIDGYLGLIQVLDQKITAVTSEIKALLKPDPRADLLMSIPGVGQLTAYLLLSEIGDIGRFSSARKLCAYAGLIPSTHQSGDHTRHGSITKAGNRYLRWSMTEAAQKAPGKDGRLGRFYCRVAVRRGKPRARIAVARKIMAAVYYVWSRGESYRVIPVKKVKSS
jgi:transposase